MTRRCSNCDTPVSDDYARVTAVDGEVQHCPECPDRVPDAAAVGGWSPAHNTREGGTGPRGTYDPEKDPAQGGA